MDDLLLQVKRMSDDKTNLTSQQQMNYSLGESAAIKDKVTRG